MELMWLPGIFNGMEFLPVFVGFKNAVSLIAGDG